MAFSFISDALRQQTSEEEKTKGMQKVFAEEAASNLLRYMAQANVKRGTERRGKQAKSASWGAEAKQDVELGRTRLEAQKETAAMSEQMGWVTAGAAAVGSITAYVAKEYEKSAQEEAEADALKEAQAAEEAPMLADFRKPGEEYAPSMLRSPGGDFSPDAEIIERGSSTPMYDPDGQVRDAGGYRGTGMTATEVLAERKAEENAFFDELIREKELEDSRARRAVEAQNKGQGRAALHGTDAVGEGLEPSLIDTDSGIAALTIEEEKERLRQLRLKRSKLAVPRRAMLIGDAE